MSWKTDRLNASVRRGSIATAAIAGVAALLCAGATPFASAAPRAKAALEEIYILRSIRERHEPVADWCSSTKTGFEPFATDAERFFSFWSLRLRPDGRVIEAQARSLSPNANASTIGTRHPSGAKKPPNGPLFWRPGEH